MLDPLTLRLLRSAGTQTVSQGRGPVVLMYHGTPQGRPNSEYSLSAARFAEQMALLRDHGWHTACVRDLAQAEQLPERTAVVTFDDGYADNYDGAFRVLERHGMRATWFVVSGIVGGHAHWMGAPDAQTAILNAAQLRDMAGCGMEIGSHTRTHPDLTALSRPEMDAELADSKQQLQDMLGGAVESFAYPYGKFDDRAAASARDAGYAFACTVRPGWYGRAPDPLRLRRVTVFAHDSAASFARKLAFADNDVSWARMARYSLGRLKDRLAG